MGLGDNEYLIHKHCDNFYINVILIYLLHCAFVPAHEVRGVWWIRPSLRIFCHSQITSFRFGLHSLNERDNERGRERESWVKRSLK